jgi:hypothetical protein
MDEFGHKKPPPDFVIRLVGKGMKPWAVPMRTLSRTLAAVQKLIDQRDDLADVDADEEQQNPDADELKIRALRLVGITTASAGYAVASKDRSTTLGILRETGKSIHRPDKADWHPSTLSSLDDLSQIAKSLNCHIEFRPLKERGGSAFGDVIAKITPSTFAEIQGRAFISGYTSVCGRLERVGGVSEMKCGIHVQGRSRMLYCCIVSGELVRELGKHIYKDVVLTGKAVWYRFNNQLKSLAVTSFDPAKTISFAEIAREIREKGGNAWDAISDPDAYIREMRG